MSGKSEWKMQPDDYDYQQELARAAFADMLHDSERVIKYNLTETWFRGDPSVEPLLLYLQQNRLYYKGLEAAIKLKRSQGEPVHVLDIGTGTGLLSMMAAQIGADSITAIEVTHPSLR